MTKIYAAFGGARTLPGAVAAGVTEAPNLGSACRALVVSFIASAVASALSCSAAIAASTLTGSTARLDEKGDARIVLQADGLDANQLQDQDLLKIVRQTIRAQVTGANLVVPTTPAYSYEQLEILRR
jgi:Na+-transporting NADH:ubiquinone oxidoreductase subunit NqrC